MSTRLCTNPGAVAVIALLLAGALATPAHGEPRPPGASGSSTAGQAITPTRFRVSVASATVRSAAGDGASRLGSLQRGAIITVTRTLGVFRGFSYQGRLGWVRVDQLQRVTSAPSAPPTASLPPGALNGTPGVAVTPAPHEVTAGSLNVRGLPDARAARIGSLSAGRRIQVTRHSGPWRGFSFEGRQGWVHGDYLRRVTGTQSVPAGALNGTPGVTTSPTPHEVTATSLNVRGLPDVGAPRIGALPRGRRIQVTRESGPWRGFSFDGRLGWVHGDHLRRVTGAASIPPGALSSTPGVTTAPTPHVVTADRVNVRGAPGLGAPVLGQLSQNDVVVVTRDAGEWKGFQRGGRLVWCFARFLRRSDAPAVPAAVTNGPGAAGPQSSRRGSGSRVVGNDTLGARVEQSATVRAGGGSQSFESTITVSGSVLGTRTTIASVRGQTAADPRSSRVQRSSWDLDLLGSPLSIRTDLVDRTAYWMRNRVLGRITVGPVPLSVKGEVGVTFRVRLSVNARPGSVGVSLTPLASLFGAVRLELDAFVAGAGVRGQFDLIRADLPADVTLARSGVTASLAMVVSSRVEVSAYVRLGVGPFSREWSVGIPFLRFTLAQVRVPILEARLGS